MQKKYCLVIVAFMFALGTIVAALPPVKADPGPVRFYVDPNVYAGLPPPPPFPPPQPNLEVAVMIESPYTWMGTADGIIGFTVSVRVDPRALKVADIVPGAYGEDFLDMYALYLQYLGYDVKTASAPPASDPASGTMWGYANGLTGPDWDISLGGAGGDAFYADDVAVLCILQFITVSETQESLIDLMGPGVSTGQIVAGIDVTCAYSIAKLVDPGPPPVYETYQVEPEDGYYVSVVDTMYFDSSEGFDPAAPMYTDWHELAPTYCNWWSIESWTDNGSPGLDESDQIDMVQTNPPGPWLDMHVDWLNPTPVAGDGLADLIVTVKGPHEAEFPLGIGLMMAIAPAIPIVYLWRTRKKVVAK